MHAPAAGEARQADHAENAATGKRTPGLPELPPPTGFLVPPRGGHTIALQMVFGAIY